MSRERGKKRGKERGRERGRERGKKGGREGGREGEREGEGEGGKEKKREQTKDKRRGGRNERKEDERGGKEKGRGEKEEDEKRKKLNQKDLSYMYGHSLPTIPPSLSLLSTCTNISIPPSNPFLHLSLHPPIRTLFSSGTFSLDPERAYVRSVPLVVGCCPH